MDRPARSLPEPRPRTPPLESDSSFVNGFARHIILLTADAGVTSHLASSARLDFNNGADALVF